MQAPAPGALEDEGPYTPTELQVLAKAQRSFPAISQQCSIPLPLRRPIRSWDRKSLHAISEVVSCQLAVDPGSAEAAENIAVLQTAQTALRCKADGQVLDPDTGRCVALTVGPTRTVAVPASVPSTSLPPKTVAAPDLPPLKQVAETKYAAILETVRSKGRLRRVRRHFRPRYSFQWLSKQQLQPGDKVLSSHQGQKLVYRQLPAMDRVVHILPRNYNPRTDKLLEPLY
jgi:hypothetical protein